MAGCDYYLVDFGFVVGEYQGANNAQGLEIMPPRVLLNELRR